MPSLFHVRTSHPWTKITLLSVFVVLATLKIAGLTDMPWVWVTAPLWGAFAAMVIAVTLIFTVGALCLAFCLGVCFCIEMGEDAWNNIRKRKTDRQVNS